MLSSKGIERNIWCQIIKHVNQFNCYLLYNFKNIDTAYNSTSANFDSI